MKFRGLLPLSNAIACLLFVALRDPIPERFRPAFDAEHHADGIFLNSGDFIMSTLACRQLNSWDEWHGGEATAVKALEAVNMPALHVAVFADFAGRISGPARRLSACGWSWVLAGIVLLVSSAQWFAIGLAADRAVGALKRRRRGPAG